MLYEVITTFDQSTFAGLQMASKISGHCYHPVGLFAYGNGGLAFQPAADSIGNDFRKFNFKFCHACDFSVILSSIVARLDSMDRAIGIVDRNNFV